MNNNVITFLESYARNKPDSIAVEYLNQKWSYRELNNYANYIARLLMDKGINKLSIVGIAGQKSFEMISAIVGVLKINCSYMPIDLSLPPDRIAAMLKNSNIKFVISHGVIQENFYSEEIVHIDIDFRQIDHSIVYSNLGYDIGVNDPAYIMHTSGSTGIPKAVKIPHRGLLRLLVNTNYIEIKSTDSILFHSNTSFDAGIFEIWAGLLNGARIVIAPFMTGDVLAVYTICLEKEITILLLTTGLFHIFSMFDLGQLHLLRYLVVGGDVMHSSAAIRTLQKNKSLTLINGYGPAENTVFTTCLVLTNESQVTNPVSIGKPITGTQVYILDDNFNEVLAGQIGEIFTGGDGVALEYINSPELNDEKFIRLSHIANNSLLYRTGDMAKKLPSGNYEFIGRHDSQVKIRGFRVDLTEIEYAISGMDCVEDVCVCTVEKPERKIAAFIKIHEHYDNDTSINKSTIISYLNQKLPNYCIPSYIEINKNLPITGNGKLDRKFLQNRLIELSNTN